MMTLVKRTTKNCYYVTVSPPVVSKSHVFIALCEKLYLLGKGGPSYFYRISIMTRNNIFIHKILLHTGQYRYRSYIPAI